MTDIQVQLARDDTDFVAARTLCKEWLDWHWENYPPDWPTKADADWLTEVQHPMDRENFQKTVSNLAVLHKRPRGGILLAKVNGKASGCVMWNEASRGVAEFHRMFVSVDGRGKGLGRKLLNSMFTQMAADGYKHVFFSSAIFLTHARTMYREAGFVDMAHPQSFPEAWRDKVYFMERSLV